MIFFLVAILILMINDMEIAPLGKYHEDYISVERSNSVKGIFILLIFMSHYAGYTVMEGPFDMSYWAVRVHLGQAVVAMFMFYSGFGIMELVKKKGFEYVKGIPVNRIFKVWKNMTIAVLIFLIMDYFIGERYSIPHILLSTIGYKNVGNSSWYIFAILLLYALTFVGFLIIKWRNDILSWNIAACLVLIMAILSEVIQYNAGRDGYTYNTMFLFPLGIFYSIYREKIERLVQSASWVYMGAVTLVFMGYMYTYFRRPEGPLYFAAWVLMFTIMFVLISMKVSFKSWILEWCGKNLFWLYILQRLPMKLLRHLGVVDRHKYFAFALSIIFTVFLTLLFDRITVKLSKLKKSKVQEIKEAQ